MKSGSFAAFHSLREILRQKVATRSPITLLLTSDEEVGSPSSRALIEAEAAKACAVLIPEPAGNPGKACVTARKGVGRFVVRVQGQSAHAGGNWEEGSSAVVTLARLITQIHALVDLPGGTTTNVAPVWGGTRPNVIAAEAGCEVDFRVSSIAKGAALVDAVMAMAGPQPEGTTVTITGGLNRPPMEESLAILALYERTRAIAAAQGYDLPKQHRGGGSDGNFTQPVQGGLLRRRRPCGIRAYPVAGAGAADGGALRAAGNPGVRPRPARDCPRPGDGSLPKGRRHPRAWG
jgi:glutamate carboxypeptidase